MVNDFQMGVKTVGLACGGLVHGGLPYSITPSDAEQQQNIQAFGQHLALQPVSDRKYRLHDANGPWFFKREVAKLFAAQDPIVNQQKWMCEWIDKTGIGWFVDWGCYHQIRLASYETAVSEVAMFYHYAHVTIIKQDLKHPGWTNAPAMRYHQKWKTTEKELPKDWKPSRFKLDGDILNEI